MTLRANKTKREKRGDEKFCSHDFVFGIAYKKVTNSRVIEFSNRDQW